ncbi:hypothetical protein ROA7450_01699 [Roseovarius albus]|uniref:Uncharacterized protein n=1 Tax=Roseovarius albus TaxID=1247867 RepID=A0A1X6YZI9_9RHOB|nr:DUF6477 family protein [Roseovarius albus]SLN35978.1 hypothetical protein ROA7450_01699 [Roseovarius albus]
MDYTDQLDSLRRPRTLIQAARIGMADYRRETHLQQCIEAVPLPSANAATAQLLELERLENHRRLDDDMTYSVKKHVEILIALMSEARLLRASQSSCNLM